MGKRVHVATKYSVSYDSSEGFNWKNYEVKSLLRSLNVDICEEDEEGYSDNWECSKEEFDKALKFLKKYKNEIYNYEEYEEDNRVAFQDICLEDVYDDIMSLECGVDFDSSYDYIIDMFESWKKQRARGCDYMHFAAF